MIIHYISIKESKIIYKYKLCSLYIIYDQYFTSNNIELAEIIIY